ncbi:MAG: ribosomal protein S18-alanine N-acetyltransferase [Phycisphaerales bacterium]
MLPENEVEEARNEAGEKANDGLGIKAKAEPKIEDIKEAVIIRRFKPEDLPDALELDRAVFGGYDPSIFRAFYEYHPRTTLVADRLGNVVGFVLGFKHTPMEGRVFWLAVKPEYQKVGIGRRLLTTLLRTFKLMGAVGATLEVRISNRNAQALYTSMGFEMTGIFPGYYSDGEAAIIMKRRL